MNSCTESRVKHNKAMQSLAGRYVRCGIRLRNTFHLCIQSFRSCLRTTVILRTDDHRSGIKLNHNKITYKMFYLTFSLNPLKSCHMSNFTLKIFFLPRSKLFFRSSPVVIFIFNLKIWIFVISVSICTSLLYI